MRTHGNLVSNKMYNPKNKKPDIPLDADEVDSAMERYIRKKYQEKSLVDGKPEPPRRPENLSRPEISPTMSNSNQSPLGAELPAPGKKHKFFGFSLRTSSKKDRAGVTDAFRITPVEYSPTSGLTRGVPDDELQEKQAQLRDMGFSDSERNYVLLKRTGGDLERTIAALVKMGSSEPPAREPRSAVPRLETNATLSSAPPTASISNNPFDQIRREEAQQSGGFGLSFDAPTPKQPLSAQPSGNPWQSSIAAPQNTGLEQQFAGMQVSNPLFPHNTGGYGAQTGYQQDPRLQTLTPPVPQLPQQYSYPSSPNTSSNPFHQGPVSSQSTGSNPFLQQQQQSQPVFAPQSNPFMNMQQSQQAQGGNPFGLPPTQQNISAPHYVASPQTPSSNPFDFPQSQISPSMQQTQQVQGYPSMTQPIQSSPFNQAQSHQPQIPNFNYGQAQQQQQETQHFNQNHQSQVTQQAPSPQQYAYQTQPFQQQQQQPQQLVPQQTGRYTKTDIMALFNQPLQQHPYLASINEDPQAQVQQQIQAQNQAYQQQQPQQHLSPAPTNDPFGSLKPMSAKRSATLPANMHSSMANSYVAASRNPFLSSTTTSRTPSGTSVASTPLQPSGQWPGQFQVPQQSSGLGNEYGASGGWNQGTRHASNESVSVNNPALMDGRHSPDAFAGLSARY